MKRKGKIIPNGVVLETHEMATVVLLTELGMDVELIRKSNKLGEHTPDLRIGSILWEIKAPKGEGKYLMVNTIQRAVKQSPNIIIDLRRAKRNQTKCLAEIKKEFEKSRSVKRIRIITKAKRLIDLRK